MKAKFVYENIRFERGVDPKAAMGIGMRERIKRMMKEDGWEYENDDNALAWASDNGYTDFVEFFLKAETNVHVGNDYALRYASGNGHKDIVEILLKAGANVHALDDIPLRRASRYNHIDVVEILLKAGANVHALDDDALRWASQKNHVDIVEILLKAGADVHAKDDRALQYASERGYVDVVELLKKWMKKNESFVYENMRFERGIDPKAAMSLGMRERIKRMMEKDNWKYYDDNNHALLWASYHGHKDIVEFLLKAGADVHTENDDALRWASRYGHIDVVELLLKAGANVHAENDWALQRASKFGHKDVVKLLKKWMRKKENFVYENMRFERRVDPKKAMGIGMKGRIKRMMEEDNWEYLNDNDALRWASKKGHIDIVEFLLKAGADVHARNDEALFWAFRNGHEDVVKLLKKYK